MSIHSFARILAVDGAFDLLEPRRIDTIEARILIALPGLSFVTSATGLTGSFNFVATLTAPQITTLTTTVTTYQSDVAALSLPIQTPEVPHAVDRQFVTLETSAKIPAGGAGILFYDSGNVSTAAVGILLAPRGKIFGITWAGDAAPGGGRTYSVEVLSDPAGVPVVLATLPIATIDTFASIRSFIALTIPADTLVGARMIRTGGAGASGFTNTVVTIEHGVETDPV